MYLPRRLRRTWFKILILSLGLLCLWDTFTLISAPPPLRVPVFQPPSHERYFIASIHWNNEAILRSHWVHAVSELIKYLGPENTYTSVLESGSWDNSKAALRGLEEALTRLGAPHNVVLDETTHLDEISKPPSSGSGWIWTPRKKKELRRIPYLSKLRNRVMEDMTKADGHLERPFTKVIWLNDVIFTTEDILTLLSTNSGKYAAACSLDFSKPPLFYDTFALRDIDGNKPITQTWPYFQSSTSRNALISNQPVPVQSCWNGIVAMDAGPFSARTPLRFRGISDSLAMFHLEGSECCLIHADNPLTPTKGVWLNPNVRVGYNPMAYDIVKGSSKQPWPSLLARLFGLWKNRAARLAGAPRRVIEQTTVRWRLRKWRNQRSEDDEERSEKGAHCLINEMQVLVENGWKHL